MKIIAIGRNYAEHARELNNPLPKEPIVFLMPSTSIIRRNKPFYYPDFSSDIHHEVELVLKISRAGKNVNEKFAGRYYDEIGIGIDFTARDLQRQAKEKGHPWEKAKAFDKAAVLSNTFISKDDFTDLSGIGFNLDINGVTKQAGNSGLMIFPFEQIISHVSKYITLKIGDLIYTGTPAGVGPVTIGDHLEGYLEGKKLLDFMIK